MTYTSNLSLIRWEKIERTAGLETNSSLLLAALYLEWKTNEYKYLEISLVILCEQQCSFDERVKRVSAEDKEPSGLKAV